MADQFGAPESLCRRNVIADANDPGAADEGSDGQSRAALVSDGA
jgi:hypothetical protein